MRANETKVLERTERFPCLFTEPFFFSVSMITILGMVWVANPQCRLILVVDDDPTMLRTVTLTLARAGFRVMVAENGATGLDTFLTAPDEIDLVLTDVVMPVMNDCNDGTDQEPPSQHPGHTHDGIFGACY